MKLSIFKEIFSFELNAIDRWSDNQNHHGYKPLNLTNWGKTCKIFSNWKKNNSIFFSFVFSKKRINVSNNSKSEMVFIIEYNNHNSIFKKIAKILETQGIRFKAIYINTGENFNDNYSEYSKSTLGLEYLFQKLLLYIWLLVNFKNFSNFSEKLLLISKFYLTSYTYYKSASHLIRKYDPKLVVFFRIDGIKDRSLASALQVKNIKTICIQHGSVVKHPKFSNAQVNEFVSWGEEYSKFMINSKANCKVTSLGAIDFDELFERANDININGINNKIKLLVMPPSGKSSSFLNDKILIINLVAKLDKNVYSLYLKPHPDDDDSELIHFAKQNEIQYLNPTSKIYYENYDIVILNNSTSGIEAAIFRKPMVLIANQIENIVVKHYIEEGIGIFASDILQLTIALEIIINNYSIYQAKCEQFVVKYLSNPGNATNKVSEYLISKVCVV